MQKIVPNLWFDNEAEEAAGFYVSVFKNSKMGAITRYPKSAEEVSGKPAGSVMTVEFELDGQQFIGINGGPDFKFSEAISFMISCKDQEEIDYYWEKLTANGGEEGPCGWLKDKFGLSWQVVPMGMDEYLSHKNPEVAEKTMAAFLKMKKIDIETLKKAHEEVVGV